MARIVCTPKVFSSSNVSATLAFVGIVGAALAFSSFNNVYAYDTKPLNTGTIETYVHVKAKIGEGRVHALGKLSKLTKQGEMRSKYNNSTGEKLNNHSKRNVARKIVKKAFSNFGHNDKSTFIFVNFDNFVEAPIAEVEASNLATLQSGYNVRQVSVTGVKSKVLKLATKKHSNVLKPNLSQYSAKRTGLKLVAGGTKYRAEAKSSKLSNRDFDKKYHNKITGLQELKFPQNGLQFVAGNGQNKLGSYIAESCTNTDFCILPNHTYKQRQGIKKIELTALRIVEKIAVKRPQPTRFSTIKFRKAVTKHVVDDLPMVIMLDEAFE